MKEFLATLKGLVVSVWTSEPTVIVGVVVAGVVAVLTLVGLSVPVTTVTVVVTVVLGALVTRLQVTPK